MLRRTISLVLAFIMAFQLSWTVAGTYCMHETGRAAEHFGHHPHVEDGDEFPVASKDKQTPAKQLVVHPHCASCHATAPVIYTPQPLLYVEWASIAPHSVIMTTCTSAPYCMYAHWQRDLIEIAPAAIVQQGP